MSNELGSASQLVFNEPVPKLLLSPFAKFLMDLLINLIDSLFTNLIVILLSDFSVTRSYAPAYPFSFVNSNNNDHLAIWRLFDTNYLRWEKNVFFYLFCCVWFLNREKTVGDLPKSGITFVLFEIFLWNMTIMCRCELSLSL